MPGHSLTVNGNNEGNQHGFNMLKIGLSQGQELQLAEIGNHSMYIHRFGGPNLAVVRNPSCSPLALGFQAAELAHRALPEINGRHGCRGL